MNTDFILHAFAQQDGLPESVIQWCLNYPEEITNEFLKILTDAANAVHQSPDEVFSLFFITHILADLQEARAFQPIIRILESNDEDLIGYLFGEDRETIPQVLLSVYDGDEHALRKLIENSSLDQFVRGQAFDTWGYLVAAGRIDRDMAHKYLLHTYEAMLPKSEAMVWASWQSSACNLGFEDLLPKALEIFKDGRMPDNWMSEEFLRNEMAQGVKCGDATQRYKLQQIFPFTDTIGSLSEWASFRSEPDPISPDLAFLHPATNVYRDVGRNDPCPCGSGKKFKKCCLH